MKTHAGKQEPRAAAGRKQSLDHGQAPLAHSLAAAGTGSAMLASKQNCACGGGCPRCSGTAPGQTPLHIRQPGDRYEQEADRVADQALQFSGRTSAPQVAALSPLPQRQAETHQAPAASAAHEGQIMGMLGEGQPLAQAERQFFEPRFRHDFSRVRIHADSSAHRLNQQLASRAFAVGNDLFFRAGEYRAGDAPARQLLAHELAHVVQQRDTHFVLQRSPDGDEGGDEALYASETAKVLGWFREAAPFPFEGWTEQKKLVDQIFANLARFVAGIRVLTMPELRKGATRYLLPSNRIWNDAADAGTTASSQIAMMRLAAYSGEEGQHEQANMWSNTILWFSGTFLGRVPGQEKEKQRAQRNFPWLANFYEVVLSKGALTDLKDRNPYELKLVYGEGNGKTREFQ